MPTGLWQPLPAHQVCLLDFKGGPLIVQRFKLKALIEGLLVQLRVVGGAVCIGRLQSSHREGLDLSELAETCTLSAWRRLPGSLYHLCSREQL